MFGYRRPFELLVLKELRKMSDTLARLQADDAALSAAIGNVATLVQSLRDANGSGDQAAIDSALDQLEASVGQLQAVAPAPADTQPAASGDDTAAGGA